MFCREKYKDMKRKRSFMFWKEKYKDMKYKRLFMLCKEKYKYVRRKAQASFYVKLSSREKF